ncbi:hypothetical protein GCM10010315_03930 [Streptomyces luteosporeus]|uniref:Uncharacterized protein n=1 Tax=Streptomyces luteosporeus TaxID=173856 RepID=A0ABN3TMH0_9ACTN
MVSGSRRYGWPGERRSAAGTPRQIADPREGPPGRCGENASRTPMAAGWNRGAVAAPDRDRADRDGCDPKGDRAGFDHGHIRS